MAHCENAKVSYKNQNPMTLSEMQYMTKIAVFLAVKCDNEIKRKIILFFYYKGNPQPLPFGCGAQGKSHAPMQ